MSFNEVQLDHELAALDYERAMQRLEEEERTEQRERRREREERKQRAKRSHSRPRR